MKVRVTLIIEHEIMQEDEKIITNFGVGGTHQLRSFSDAAKLALGKAGFEVGADYGDGYINDNSYTVVEMEVIHDEG